MSERARAALRALADALAGGLSSGTASNALLKIADDDALWSESLVEEALRNEMHSHSPIVGVEGKMHGIVGCFCDKSTRSETFNFEHHMYQSVIAAGVVASLAEDEAGLRERITALLASRACHQCGGTGRTTNMEQGAPASVGKQELVECSLCVGGGYLNLGYVPVKDLAAALAAPADGGGTE